MEYKTLIDDYFRKVPEYYPEMYQDGFTPEEIMYAFRKQMRRQAEDERPVKINFSSEVKIKRCELTIQAIGARKRKSSDGNNPSWKRRFSGLWNRAFKRRWTQPLMRYSNAGTKNKISGFSSDI